jgi:hypothetical protein
MPDPLGLTLPQLPTFPGYGQVNSAVSPLPTDPNAAPVPPGGDLSQDLPPDPGLMSRFGNFVSLPGYAARNLMMGEPGAAGRNLTDFLGDIPSAIPGVGGFIPTLSTQADKPSFSDVTGGMDPSFGRSALNFFGDALTDPVSAIPGSWVGKGLGAIGKGIGAGMSVLDQVAPKTSEMLRGGYYAAKGTMGWLGSKVPETQTALDTSKQVGLTEGEAAAQAVPQIPNIADPELAQLAHGVTNNVYPGADGQWREILPSAAKPAEDAAAPVADGAGEAADALGATDTAPKEPLPIPEAEPAIAPGPVQSASLDFFPPPKTDLQIAQEASATAEKAAADGVEEPLPQTFVTKPQQMALHDARLQSLVDKGIITSDQQGKLHDLLDGQTDFAQALWKNEVERKVMTDPVDLTGAGAGKPANPDLFPVDYSPRKYVNALTPEEKASLGAIEMTPKGVGSGGEAMTAARSVGHGQEYADYLNKAKEAGITPNTDLASNWAARAAAHGNATAKATLAQSILADKFTSLADRATNGAMQEAMVSMAKVDPEGAILLKNQFFGMGPRHPAMQVLNNLAAPFKKSAVYGLGFPQVGHIVRNILSHPFQYGFQGHIRLAINQALRTPATMWHALQIGVHKTFGFQLPYDKISGMIKARDAAMAQSGGSALKAAQILRDQGMPDVALALEHGVGQGFVSQEVLQDQLGKSGWGRRLMSGIGVGKPIQDRLINQMNVPEEVFRGEEQYARFGGFMDQLQHYRDTAAKAGTSDFDAAAKAAKDVRDSLYDYTPQTPGNRTLRTIIPFAAFQTNAIRQTAGAFARWPALATAVGGAMQRDPNDPKYPYMEGKANVPLGLDEKGNPQYISQIGLPMEAINTIPNPSAGLRNFGDLTESNVIGSMNPILKTAYEIVSGHDPYFKTPMGSYDKVPLLGHAGAFGQAYNTLEGTGLIQPLTSPLTQLQHLTDDRHDVATRLLNTFTGANVVSVDPKIAEQQVLQKALSLDPNVTQYIRFQPTNGDTQAKGLINQMNSARKAVAQEKKAPDTQKAGAPESPPKQPNQRFPARPLASASKQKAAAASPQSAPAGALPLQ